MSQIKSLSELREFIYADAYRYNSTMNHVILRSYWIPDFRFTFWLRVIDYLHSLSTKKVYNIFFST